MRAQEYRRVFSLSRYVCTRYCDENRNALHHLGAFTARHHVAANGPYTREYNFDVDVVVVFVVDGGVDAITVCGRLNEWMRLNECDAFNFFHSFSRFWNNFIKQIYLEYNTT